MPDDDGGGGWQGIFREDWVDSVARYFGLDGPPDFLVDRALAIVRREQQLTEAVLWGAVLSMLDLANGDPEKTPEEVGGKFRGERFDDADCEEIGRRFFWHKEHPLRHIRQGVQWFDVPQERLPILGSRAWRVATSDSGQPQLMSRSSDTLWPPNEPLTASCSPSAEMRTAFGWSKLGPHRVPSFDCSCGIDARKLSHSLRLEGAAFFGHAYHPSPMRFIVFGEVKLWGTVIECPDSLRASTAYPAQLYVLAIGGSSAEGVELASELASTYGVPVAAKRRWHSRSAERPGQLWETPDDEAPRL